MTEFRTLDQLPLALTADDIAMVLGVSKYNAYCLMRSDGFPMKKMGRRLLVQKPQFVEWLYENFGV